MAPLALEGAVPREGADQEIALAALTRRVAELEHRLDVMKVVVGLVLAGKLLIVLLFVYVLFGGGPALRGGGEARPASRAALLPGDDRTCCRSAAASHRDALLGP